LAEWCAIPIGELQNYIPWRLKRFADFTDYVDHDKYISRCNVSKYIRYNTAPTLVTSFQCDEQALDMVRCTGPSWWRKHKPPRNNTVHLWMGTRLDSHLKSTAGHITTWLKWLFIIQDDESSIKGLVALVHTIVTGPIHHCAGMGIIKERNQPPIEPLNNTIVCIISPSEPLISSLQAQSKEQFTFFHWQCSQIACGGTWATRLTHQQKLNLLD
jgi:hypothetical protein